MSVIDATLKDFGSKYFQDIINRPKPQPPIKYGRNHLQIGRIIDKNTGEITNKVYYLDIEEAARILILGITRAGKSYVLKSIGDRVYNLKDSLVYLTDVKNEFFAGAEAEVQEKFRPWLLPGEKPAKTPVVTLRPTFFKQIEKNKPKSNFWYSIDSKKLSRADFMTLMNVNELSPTQKTSMELIFQDFQKKIGAEPNTQMDYKTMEKIIQENMDLDARQKQILTFKFKPLESSHFVEEEHAKSIITLLEKGYVPAINLENFDSFGKSSFQYPEVLLNIALREIIQARRAKKIPRTWIFIDEAERFLNKNRNTSIRSSVSESFGLDSRYGINYITCWQNISSVPEDLLRQSKFIFIPSSADISTIKQVLNDTGMVKNVQVSINTAMRLKRLLKKVKYSWVVLDRNNSSMDLIYPLSPLSFFLETTK